MGARLLIAWKGSPLQDAFVNVVFQAEEAMSRSRPAWNSRPTCCCSPSLGRVTCKSTVSGWNQQPGIMSQTGDLPVREVCCCRKRTGSIYVSTSLHEAHNDDDDDDDDDDDVKNDDCNNHNNI